MRLSEGGAVWLGGGGKDEKSGGSEGGDERVHFGVGVVGIGDGGGDGGAEGVAEAFAETVDGAACGGFGDAEGGGEVGVVEVGAVGGETGLEDFEFAGAVGGLVIETERVHDVGEDGEGPAAVEVAVRVGWGMGVEGGEGIGGGVETEDGGAAAAFEGIGAIPFVGEEAFHGDEEEGSEAAAVWVGAEEPVAREEAGEEFLSEVFGVVRGVAAVADP